jgi:itaconate CoA-transferase
MLEAVYQSKKISKEQLSGQMLGVSNLILGMSVAMPRLLLSWLSECAEQERVAPFNLYYMHGSEHLRNTLLKPSLSGRISPRPLFLSASDRQALAESKDEAWMQFVPTNFHQVGRLLTAHISPDCFMVTVSSMDKHGYFSLGTNADYGASVIRKARRVVVEVNSNMPKTFGECTIHISEIDALVEHDEALCETQLSEPGPIDKIIASQIAEHIHDEDTLQMGVGGVPNAVLGMLDSHRNLGLHSELFSPAMVRLIQWGVLTGKKKSWMQHKHVFTLALGDKAMYDFMDDNPSIVGYPASWVNNPAVISKNNNMVSVNAAIEVDLTGQVNAEHMNGQQFSGTGGQLDFVRGLIWPRMAVLLSRFILQQKKVR